MGSCFSAFFVRADGPNDAIKAAFQRLDESPGSGWVVCNFRRDETSGCYDTDKLLTTRHSAKLGDVMFVFYDKGSDQLSFERSQGGMLRRKLVWLSDGCRSSWAGVAGEDPEPWEGEMLFAPRQLDMALQRLRDELEDGEIDQAAHATAEAEARAAMQDRRFVIGKAWPPTDAMDLALAIMKFYGIQIPAK